MRRSQSLRFVWILIIVTQTLVYSLVVNDTVLKTHVASSTEQLADAKKG